MRFKTFLSALAGSAAMLGLLAPAVAQVPEIRLAKQYSMGYLQLNVIEHQKLIEKHAKLLGIPEVKVSWETFNGPAAINDALLSGNIDIASGGVPGLLVLWAKTKGTPQEVRGVSALSSQPFLLNSRNPDVKTIKDLKQSDRIAVPAVKVSVQAIMLQMAAAKAFGEKEFAKFDVQTVSLSPPDATIALMGGKSEINAAFSVPPFQYQQLDQPGVHTVLNSFDVMGGSHSFTVAWTSAKFRDKNPVLYKALIAALREATDIVNKDKAAAGALWIEDSKSKLPREMVAKIVAGPQVRWTMTPENTMKFADFMTGVGTLKVKAASWKDYFFPEIYDLKGS
jgi:NitT/TauT family transport system substrate-binding protein